MLPASKRRQPDMKPEPRSWTTRAGSRPGAAAQWLLTRDNTVTLPGTWFSNLEEEVTTVPTGSGCCGAQGCHRRKPVQTPLMAGCAMCAGSTVLTNAGPGGQVFHKRELCSASLLAHSMAYCCRSRRIQEDGEPHISDVSNYKFMAVCAFNF